MENRIQYEEFKEKIKKHEKIESDNFVMNIFWHIIKRDITHTYLKESEKLEKSFNIYQKLVKSLNSNCDD